MDTLNDIDLRTDAQAQHYLKDEIVDVVFATEDGIIASTEGLNHYISGDALITGSTGDCWSVSLDRFDVKYTPITSVMTDTSGKYRNQPIPVLAKQMPTDFSIPRTANGDIIFGHAGDWLLQYSPGDHGIVANSKFQQVYRRCD
ncbi:MAG: PGDYG domain-containing protein [Steroidobacteraceae bacterium]